MTSFRQKCVVLASTFFVTFVLTFSLGWFGLHPIFEHPKYVATFCRVERKEEVSFRCCNIAYSCTCGVCIPNCDLMTSQNLNSSICCRAASCCLYYETQLVCNPPNSQNCAHETQCLQWSSTEMCNAKCGMCLNATLTLVAPESSNKRDVISYKCGLNDQECMNRVHSLYAEESRVSCFIGNNHLYIEHIPYDYRIFWYVFAIIGIILIFFVLFAFQWGSDIRKKFFAFNYGTFSQE